MSLKLQEFVHFCRDAVMITLVRVVRQPRIGVPAWAPEKPFFNHHAWQEKRTMFKELVRRLWCEQEGQDIAEYAVMLAVILVIVVGTIRLIGSNANNVFSNVASSIQ
jgi:Flp pilus assembly pilin Flp